MDLEARKLGEVGYMGGYCIEDFGQKTLIYGKPSA